MAVGIFAPLLIWAPVNNFLSSLIISAAIIVFFGVIDDFRGIDYKLKFFGQVAAALVIVIYGNVQIRHLGNLFPEGFNLPIWVGASLTIFIIVGVTNAINLSDGLDGLAGGISLLSFICIGYLGFCNENLMITLCAMAVIGAIFGFLRYNSYPSVLFMGDTGSQLLGFFSIILAIFLTQQNTPLSPALPLLIIGFPILDTFTVMVARIAAGESPFKADNRHFHHKLIGLGLYHTEAVLLIYFMQAFYVFSAFIFRFQTEWFLIGYYAIASSIILAVFFMAYHFQWKMSRESFFDTIIKGRLRSFKETNLLIKFSFYGVKMFFPLVLLITCLVPKEIPFYFSIIAFIVMSIFLITWKLNKSWIDPFCGIIFYLMIPILVYIGETNPSPWAATFIGINTTLFAVLLIFSYLTLKFTRRKNGFKTTPLDFLIVFIVLVIPMLPDPRIQNLNIGFSAIKIIVFYLGFEVLTGEIRNKINLIGVMFVAMLSIICLRGIFG